LTLAANPLPQALVLTAIVIGFALLCFSLVVVMAIAERSGKDDLLLLRYTEPKDTASVAPPFLEEEKETPWQP
jgi:multicomponent Na+:H+ antiporter subunit C